MTHTFSLHRLGSFLAACLFLFTFCKKTNAQPVVSRDMVFNLTGLGNAHQLFDGDPSTVFEPRHAAGFTATPATVILRLNPAANFCKIKKIRFERAPGASGKIQIFAGSPGAGNWNSLSAPQIFQNGSSAFEWYPANLDARFLKFVFEKNDGDPLPQHFLTGEIFLDFDGDCTFSDGFSDCAVPGTCPFNDLPFEKRMGVNNFIGKTQLYYQAGPFAAVREYLPWDHIQGHFSSGNLSADGESQPFRFAPSFPGYDLDNHYQNLKDFGREVLGTFKESSPFQLNFDYAGTGNNLTMNQLGMSFSNTGSAYLNLMERKPGQPAGGVAPNNPKFFDPETYADHARAMQQLDLRYGKNGNPEKAKFEDAASANQGTFSFLENWNEQDKWWRQDNLGSTANPDFEQRLAFFTPQEYMAMTFADRFSGPASGGSNLPLVMSGLTDFDAEYVRGCFMAWWELTGEDPANTFPFHALNLHHYSVENWQRGLVPEGDPELAPGNPNSGLNRIINFRNKYLPQQQVWVTEFGFSDHPQDATTATPHYPNPDLEETQAQWLVRNYLLFNRLGVDRAFSYQLSDDGPNAWHGYFNHTGMIDRTDNGGAVPEFRLKKSWYYLFTLRNRLEGFHFKSSEEKTTATGRPVWIYTFENEDFTKKIRVIWIPTDTDPTTTDYILPVKMGSKIKVVEFAQKSITGHETELEDSDGDGFLEIKNVGERPILVIEGDAETPMTCDCQTEMTWISGNISAKNLTDETSQIAESPRCEYGSEMKNLWSGAAGLASGEAVFNLGGGDENDELEIGAVFINDPNYQAGELKLDFLDSAGDVAHHIIYDLDGQPIYPQNVLGKNFVWKRFENLHFRAAKLRVTKSDGAAVGEILVCAKGQPTQIFTDPPPAPTSDCVCKPTPISIFPANVFYEISPGQTVSNYNFLGDACADGAPDKSPFRMFDEQNLIGKMCETGYFGQMTGADFFNCNENNGQFPVQEWFPGWSGFPFKSVVHFDEPQIFNGIYIYDSYDEGKISIEYRDGATDNWKTLALPDGKSYRTDSWRKWVLVFQTPQPLFATDFRVTMKDAGARFSEMALCLNPIVKKDDAVLSENSAKNDGSVEPTIFPNPTVGLLNLIPGSKKFDHLRLADVTGRTVFSKDVLSENGAQKIDLQEFAGGVYFLFLEKDGEVVWRGKVVRD